MRQPLAFLALLGLASCAAPFKATEITPTSPRLRELKAVQILVTAEQPGAERTIGYFRSSLISELARREVFVYFVKSDEPGASEVKLEVALSGFRGVSEAARALVGGMAGKAKLTAAVTLTDLKSGEDLGAFFIYGKTGAYADAGSTSDVVESVAIGIVDYLRGRRSQ